MAKTTFSGPVVSSGGFTGNITGTVLGAAELTYLLAPASTGLAAALADAADSKNTTLKLAGAQYTDLDDGLIYTASGSDATSVWYASDGTSSITPS